MSLRLKKNENPYFIVKLRSHPIILINLRSRSIVSADVFLFNGQYNRFNQHCLSILELFPGMTFLQSWSKKYIDIASCVVSLNPL